MKIHIISRNLGDILSGNSKSIGGTEMQILQYCTELSKNGHSVTLHTSKSLRKYEDIFTNPIFTQRSNRRITQIINFYLFEWFRLFFYLIKNRPDVIITSVNSRYSVGSIIASKLLQIPTIYRFAHDTEARGISLSGNRFLGLPFRLTLLITKPNLIFQHNNQKQLFNDYYKFSSNNIIFRNSFHKEAKNIISQKSHILWIGKNNAIKQPLLYLELAQKLPEYTFTFLCNGELSNNIKDILLNTENISFVSHLPFEEADSLFNDALCFVSTSTSEGYPNTFLQAFKKGIPVVSFNVDPENAITTHKLGLVNSNIDTVCTYIQKLNKTDTMYNQTSNRCLNYFNRFHSWEENYTRLENFLYACSTNNTTIDHSKHT